MSSLPNLPAKTNLILGIIGEIFKKSTGKARDAAEVLIVLLGIAVLFAIACAPFKILLRKNFGQAAISSAEIIFGGIFFGLWAYISIAIAVANNDRHDNVYSAYFFNPFVLIFIAMTFLVVAICTIVKGFQEQAKHNQFATYSDWKTENYRGDSILYQKFVTNQSILLKVWRKIEPDFCFKWSFLLLIIHPLLGFPFLFASVAFWVNEYFHVRYRWEKLDTEGQQTNASQGDSFGGGNFVGSKSRF